MPLSSPTTSPRRAPDPMRVCILTEYAYPACTGGTPAVISNLARYLQDHTAELQLELVTSANLYRGEAAALPTHEFWDGIEIFRIKTPRSNRRSTAMRLGAGMLFTLRACGKLLV